MALAPCCERSSGAPCLNPAYDPTRPYRSRAERAEWDMVGLLGRLRLRTGQPTDPRWIRLRALRPGKNTPPEGLEDWLIR
uniref:peptidase G2 autoproteolytic cleavage domain-containing protein n=1 Tax=Phaeobacter sp. BS34 TaxID=2907240 RepID=UPI003703E221